MTDLQELPGIGRGLAAELRAVGVRDVEALRTLGAAAAAERLAELGLQDAGAARQRLEAALGAVPAAASRALPRPTVLGVDNVVLTVGDLDAALAHYADGLGLPVAFRLPDPPLAVLRLGTEPPGLLLREDPAVPEAPARPGSARVWLEVPDAVLAAEQLRTAGVTGLGEVFSVATGRTVELTDRWGNVLGLTDHSAAPERGRQST